MVLLEMDFSKGQLIFALVFFVVFVIIMVFAYRKDRALSRIHYKGVIYIFLGILCFLLIYMLLSKLLS